MNRNQKIIVSVTGIFLVGLILAGLTYAYFLTRINGNPNNQSIGISTANLSLDWIDGTDKIIDSDDVLIPGEFESSITFSVENTGNATVEDYGVIIDNLRVKVASDKVEEQIDTYLEYPETMKLTVCILDEKKDCVEDKYDSYLPTTNEILFTNDIDAGAIHEYKVTLKYIDQGNQSADMNKSITARLDIIDTKNTAVLAGVVMNKESGDYIQTNSKTRTTSIDKNGNYKIVGLEIGNHTVSVKDKANDLLGSKYISINKEDSRIEINIDREDKTFYVGKTSSNPYEEGTLAYEIINNAYNTSLVEESLGYAYYRETPINEIGTDQDFKEEASLSIAEDDYIMTTNKYSYYYRGNVKNNYVEFNNMCWRIVRIEGDGSVKLTLAKEGLCSTITENDTKTAFIGAGYYGYEVSDNLYDDGFNNDSESTETSCDCSGLEGIDLWICESGIDCETSGDASAGLGGILKYYFYANYENSEKENVLGNTSIKYKFDEWFNGTLRDGTLRFTFDKKEQIKDTKICIGDTKNKYDSDGNITVSIEEWFYDNYKRLYNDMNVTLICNTEGLSSNNYKVYPLTIDEIVLAGGLKTNNTYYYLIDNADDYWWTLSISKYYETKDYVFRVSSAGNLEEGSVDVYSYSFRPAISLIPGIRIINGGIGTIDNPYVIN